MSLSIQSTKNSRNSEISTTSAVALYVTGNNVTLQATGTTGTQYELLNIKDQIIINDLHCILGYRVLQ